MFEQFSPAARRFVIEVSDEAQALNNAFVGTEHFLIRFAVSEDDFELTPGVDVSTIRAGLNAEGGGDDAEDRPPFTPAAKDVLEKAAAFADAKHEDVDLEHLFIALLALRTTEACRLLVAAGIDPDAALGHACERYGWEAVTPVVSDTRLDALIDDGWEAFGDGDLGRAQELFEEAVQGCEASSNVDVRIRAQAGLARTFRAAGRADEALEVCGSVPRLDGAWQARTAGSIKMLAATAAEFGDDEGSRRLLEEGLAFCHRQLAASETASTRAAFLAEQADLEHWGGDQAAAAATASAAITAAEEAGRVDLAIECLRLRGRFELRQGRSSDAKATFERMSAHAGAAGTDEDRSEAAFGLGAARGNLGEHDAAVADLRRATQLGSAADNPRLIRETINYLLPYADSHPHLHICELRDDLLDQRYCGGENPTMKEIADRIAIDYGGAVGPAHVITAAGFAEFGTPVRSVMERLPATGPDLLTELRRMRRDLGRSSMPVPIDEVDDELDVLRAAVESDDPTVTELLASVGLGAEEVALEVAWEQYTSAMGPNWRARGASSAPDRKSRARERSMIIMLGLMGASIGLKVVAGLVVIATAILSGQWWTLTLLVPIYLLFNVGYPQGSPLIVLGVAALFAALQLWVVAALLVAVALVEFVWRSRDRRLFSYALGRRPTRRAARRKSLRLSGIGQTVVAMQVRRARLRYKVQQDD